MKKLVFLLCLFLTGMNMSAQTKVVHKNPARKVVSRKNVATSKTVSKKTPSNAPKQDYMNFDASGQYLVSFRHTCEDGSYMEVEGTYYKDNEYFYRPVTICDSEGNKYTGTFYIGPFSKIKNLNDCCRVKSYNNFLELFSSSLRSYDSYGEGDDTFIETKDKQKKYYYSDNQIRYVFIKDGEGYIVYNCERDSYKNLDDVRLEKIYKRYAVYTNGSILLTNYSDVVETEIKYDNGDKYKGKIDMSNMPIGSDAYKSGIEMPQFAYTDGVMRLNDGNIRVYVNGEIDEFESRKPVYKNLFPQK